MKYLIVGRPNVGKSSIFNILTGRKANIIHKKKGTTRDWHRGEIRLIENSFIFDVPGIILNPSNDDEKKTKRIIESLIPNINYLLFVVDFHFYSFNEDVVILQWLRTFNRKIVLLVNKKDNNKQNVNTDFYKYGINNIFFLSCSHRLGFDKLRKFLNDKIHHKSNKLKNIHENIDHSIAIFGKPNTGKSTFLNTLLDYERSLTSVVSGTTTDYVNEIFKYKSKIFNIFDTAGIGRKSKISSKSIDHLAIQKSINKIKKVQSTIILIDSYIGLNRQDKRVIKLLSINAKSLLLVFNKIDLIKNKLNFKKKIISEIENNIYQVKNVKVFFISALSKKQVITIIDYIYENILVKKYNLNTSMINKWLKFCSRSNPHPLIDRKKVNFKYGVKIKDYPITVKIFCNQAEKINKNYIRYLKNNFNSYFKILNQNIKIIFSKSKNPYSR